MGKRGREIDGARVKDILVDLNAAYAFEWQATYWFWLAARLTRGVAGHEVAELFEDAVKEEMGHAGRFADRIAELGGTPVLDPAKLNEAAFAKWVNPPAKGAHTSYLKQALGFEREAITFYKALAEKTRDVDLVTWKMVVEILADEVEDEEKYENYLGAQ